MQTILVSWSGGKDSCMALDRIVRAGNTRVAALLTTVTRESDEISMHGVGRALLERQAAALGLPLKVIIIPAGASNREYEAMMSEALAEFRENGVDSIAFGDLFLEDIKAYREQFLARLGMRALFPVWRRDTSRFIRTFIELGYRAITTAVDASALDKSFAGKTIDDHFLRSLPAGVDPCGENGEFHTFVYAGPLFKREIMFSVGGISLRGGHYFCDLLPPPPLSGEN